MKDWHETLNTETQIAREDVLEAADEKVIEELEDRGIKVGDKDEDKVAKKLYNAIYDYIMWKMEFEEWL